MKGTALQNAYHIDEVVLIGFPVSVRGFIPLSRKTHLCAF